MIAHLKKLEVAEGNMPSPRSETRLSDKAKPKSGAVEDRRLLTVPNNGWLDGPGRGIARA